jgi:hypothetical protein
MKVQDPNLAGTSAATTPTQPSAAVTRQQAGRDTAERPSDVADRLELSGFTDRLGGVLRAQSQARAGRVAALERDFQSGRYAPDAWQISRAIVRETLSGAWGGKGPTA